MRIAFYSPMKPIDHPTPSGDRMIAQWLYSQLSLENKVFILSRFRSRWFFKSPLKWFVWIIALFWSFICCLRNSPDLFFTYHSYYKAPDPLAPILSLLFKKPYIVFEGMYSPKPRNPIRSWLGYRLNRWALQRADIVFVYKSRDLEGLKKLLPSNKIRKLSPSLNPKTFIPNKNSKETLRQKFGIEVTQKIVISVAMLRPDRKTQGVEFLLNSLCRLQKNQNQNVFWIHLGGGQEFDRIKELAGQLLGNKFYMPGKVSQKELIYFLQGSDVFAFPGIDESFGMVYVEAQACGLPVVAFNNKGTPDSVGKDSGVLTKLLDQSEFDQALLKILSDPSKAKDMSVAARAFFLSHFDENKNYNILKSTLESISVN